MPRRCQRTLADPLRRGQCTFCSRTLSDAERRYAQIEKECLAAVWASECFYQYLCGLESYTIQTDHKPLVPLINSKDLDTTPLRCQRLLIRLMKFNPVAVYVPGKNLVAADALSRHPLQSTELGDLEQEVRAHMDAIEESVGVRRPVLEQIKEQTERDSELQRVLNYTRNGWPDHIKSVAMSAKQYFPERGTLSELNGVLRRGYQIVIPYSMRDDMIQKIHQGHQGLTKCRQRYKNAIWWPGIGNDSNGMAERAVKTAKAILKQADPHMALLSYRSTPTEPTRDSPSKLMMGRSLRTTLPTLKENLRPPWPDLEKVRLKIDGEKTWKTTAVVQQEEAAPRSFTLQTDRGNTPRRNRRCVQLVNRESPAEPPAVPPEPVHPETVHPELSVTQPVSSHPTAGRGSPVVTRSGRMVKPNRRFDT
ncbi:hypothetical protein SKAU_G00094580 [Synaphobranchus kaupii]|uniref:Gypsy retrotransposon integrase-like protein 1 n=1 Tax=Synaphobranchus kaupii TaxID=118154 RepID=A0A9Q1FY88_SYNKA|nr:hypothetical protein SKAU_G00094580 [Synaphobranchus kaupii]